MFIAWLARGTDQPGKTLLDDAVDSSRKEGEQGTNNLMLGPDSSVILEFKKVFILLS